MKCSCSCYHRASDADEIIALNKENARLHEQLEARRAGAEISREANAMLAEENVALRAALEDALQFINDSAANDPCGHCKSGVLDRILAIAEGRKP